MKKVFICSALRGDVENNIKKAKEYSRQAVLEGYLPITPHIYFTQFLNDDIIEERNTGIKMGIDLLKGCDEIWVYGEITIGMAEEIQIAKERKITITYK
jgi:hypothetical protein